MTIKILVINSGSSSLKFALFENLKLILKGKISGINSYSAKLILSGIISDEQKCNIKDQSNAIELILKILKDAKIDVIDAIGHRFVFGGDAFTSSVIIDEKVLQSLKELISYDLIHMPYQIENVELFKKKFPKTIQVACFDTSFHLNMPEKAKMFALNYSLYEMGIKRYGFHGLSFESIISNEKINLKKNIVAHLGSGSSICAIKNKISIDTTMGLTSIGGIAMMERSGDLDPGIILYLLDKKKYTVDELKNLLYKEAGLNGIAGVSDMELLLKKVENDQNAKNAVELFCYQIAKVIGSYIAALNGVDAIVFTGGIGENSAIIRKKVIDQLSFFGVHLNDFANQQNESIISNDFSEIKVLVIPSNEELMILKHVKKIAFS